MRIKKSKRFSRWIGRGCVGLCLTVGSAGSLLAADPLKGGVENNAGVGDVYSSQGDEWVGTSGPDNTMRSKPILGGPCPKAANGWYLTNQTDKYCYYQRDVPGDVFNTNPKDRNTPKTGDVNNTNPKNKIPSDIYNANPVRQPPGDVYNTNPKDRPCAPATTYYPEKCPQNLPIKPRQDVEKLLEKPKQQPTLKGKDIVRDDGQSPRPAGKNPDATTLVAAMDRCLRQEANQLRYYSSPRIVAVSGAGSPPGSTITYDQESLKKESPWMRGMILGNAFATYVLNLRQQRYGINTSQDQLTYEQDMIVGFLMGCLGAYQVLQTKGENPPQEYVRFLRRTGGLRSPGDSAEVQDRRNNFDEGWGLMGAGLPRSITME
jgi:hypothetical protein